jgi:hypothetical protein
LEKRKVRIKKTGRKDNAQESIKVADEPLTSLVLFPVSTSERKVDIFFFG